MIRTGVFATEEESDEINRLAEVARETPVIAMSMLHGLSSGGFSGEAWDRCHKRLHAIAISHGLLEIPGHYGFDSTNREFLSTYPVKPVDMSQADYDFKIEKENSFMAPEIIRQKFPHYKG